MITETAIAVAVAATAGLFILGWKLRSARLQSKAALDAARSQFQSELDTALDERNHLLDALGDPFLLVSLEANILFANSAACDLFGNRDLVGRTVQETFFDARLTDPIDRCLETRQHARSRIVLPQQMSPLGTRESRGANAWIVDAAPLPSPEGGSPITRVIVRDVTSEHQIEQIRKDFVANASHELRTPMAIIGGYLENLIDDDMVDEAGTARHFLKIMRKHSDRISRIIEDMLVISRLESGESNPLTIKPFPIRSCINDVLERLESVIRKQQADVQIIMPDDEAILHGDRFYWTQLLFNLVENALKQNPHPGLRVEIGCKNLGENFHIWVTDNGIGIPSADLPHIFRRFFRVDKHHSQREIKGTGLGLSIVKRAIEAHGGDISVTSVPGSETKFLITLPLPPPNHVSRRPPE